MTLKVGDAYPCPNEQRRQHQYGDILFRAFHCTPYPYLLVEVLGVSHAGGMIEPPSTQTDDRIEICLRYYAPFHENR